MTSCVYAICRHTNCVYALSATRWIATNNCIRITDCCWLYILGICIFTTHCNNMNSVYLKQQTAKDFYCQYECRFAMSCHLRSPYIYIESFLFSYFRFNSFHFDLFVCLSKSLSLSFSCAQMFFSVNNANILEIRKNAQAIFHSWYIERGEDKSISWYID